MHVKFLLNCVINFKPLIRAGLKIRSTQRKLRAWLHDDSMVQQFKLARISLRSLLITIGV